jgi:nucleoside-diphosphate-sugar epimerase
MGGHLSTHVETPRTTVLVVGGTGRTGAHLVHRLCADPSFQVIVLARDAAKAAVLQETSWPAPVRVIEGDLGDVDAWASHLAGVDQVVTAVSCGVRTFSDPLGVLGVTRPPANMPQRIDGEGIGRLCDAAAAHGVRRVVAVTTASAGTPWSAPAVFLNAIAAGSVKWKFAGEQAIRRSGLDYVIVRPFGLLDTAPLGGDTGLGVEHSQGKTDGARKRIPRADVAALCHEALRQPAGTRTSFECWATDAHARRLPWARLRAEPPGSVADVDHDAAVAVAAAVLVGAGGLAVAGLGRGGRALLRLLRNR